MQVANIFNLPERSYESLFDLAEVPAGDVKRRTAVEADLKKFQAGRKAVMDSFAELGRQGAKSNVRTNPHFLSRGYLQERGLDLTRLPTGYQYWFCTFDLDNRSNNDDPNGPRRIICVCENAVDASGRYYPSTAGGKIRYLIYTNNHYGDNRKKEAAFELVLPPKIAKP